jgi:hypothetical protein
MTNLPRTYVNVITQLYEAGGSGHLDTHGRVQVDAPRRPLPGDPIAWLTLVAAGLVAGDSGRLILTEAGRAMAVGTIAGRTREA